MAHSDEYWWQDMGAEEFDKKMTELFDDYFNTRLNKVIMGDLGIPPTFADTECPDKLEPHTVTPMSESAYWWGGEWHSEMGDWDKALKELCDKGDTQ